MFIARIGYLSVISLAMTFFTIALDQVYRPYSYIALMVFVFSAYVPFLFIKNKAEILTVSKKTALVFLFVAILCVLQALNTFRLGEGIASFELIKIFYSLFSLSAIYLSVKIWGMEWYSERLVKILVILSIFSIFLYFSGFYLDSTNFYASMLLIPVMYCLLVRKNFSFIVLLALLLFLGGFFGARGAYIVILIFLFVYVVGAFIKIRPVHMLLVVLSLLIIQFVILKSNSLFFDEMLSYRPTIWSFYFDSTLGNKWFGNGQITDYSSEGAAEYYQYMISRGVGTAYGTQSMYMLYFYETGIVGIMLLIAIMHVVFSTKSTYLIPVLAILTLAFMETVRVGSISVYGLPMSYFIVLSLISYEENHA
jgi:hypothetical protein